MIVKNYLCDVLFKFHWVKSVQKQSFFWSVFSRTRTEYGSEKTPYLDTFHAVFLIKTESTWRCKIKEQTPQLTLLYCGRTVRSSHQRCSIKKVVLKKIPVLESLFEKVAGLKVCNFIKKRPQHRWFPVNIAKFLRLSILKNIGCFLTVLMVHCNIGLKFLGLDCVTASGFRVRVFCF